MSESTGIARVEGWVAAGFEQVEEAFRENFTERGEVGASLAVYRGGVPMVDLWGGLADPRTGAAWEEDTLVLIYSATKGPTATLVNLLAERGELDLDAPVTSYWPEFGAAGKKEVTARTVLAHRAGLPVLEADLSLEQLFDGHSAAAALARQAPLWAPGEAHGYHGLTFGWLIAEIVSRATGTALGRHFAEQVAGPLGAELYIGCPAEAEGRIARQVDPDPPDAAALEAIGDRGIRALVERAGGEMGNPDSVLARSLNASGVLPTPAAETYADPLVHRGEQPAVNGIGNGRSMARLYAACIGEVDGTRLFSEGALAAATAERSGGADEVLLVPSRFGTGFMLQAPISEMLSPASFGHVGAGGALGFADPDAELAFGYAQSKLGTGMVGDPRTEALIDAVKRSLA